MLEICWRMCLYTLSRQITKPFCCGVLNDGEVDIT